MNAFAQQPQETIRSHVGDVTVRTRTGRRLAPARPLDDLDQMRDHRPAISPLVEGVRVAIVQEWISARAGSEKVFEALAALVPNADLYALSAQPGVRLETDGRPIITTALDRPFFRNNLAAALPLMPAAWKQVRRHDYDIVITSSHAFSRCFVADRTQHHLSYVHSPARYVWFPDIDKRSSFANRAVARAPRKVLQQVDLATVDRTSSFAANSTTTRDRIDEVYKREARVIAPPVATAFYRAAPETSRTHLLAFSRFIPYKRLDDAIRVAHRLGEKLVVAGSGPEERRLRNLAADLGADVEFKIRPTDHELRRLYAGAKALLFFAEEDFGIVPVEAQAAGCPVVTCGRGGATDTVTDGVTGIHANSESLDDLHAAAQEALQLELGGRTCRAKADTFSYARFATSISDWLRSDLS